MRSWACGAFGMARETAEFLNAAIAWGASQGLGLGQAVGRRLVESDFPHRDLSLVAAAAALEVPLTVHVAVGTDIIHLHPSVLRKPWERLPTGIFGSSRPWSASWTTGSLSTSGSAVIIPEVFLKALTLARNLGHKASPLTTVNLDFVQHYRPLTNVVRRPTVGAGQGFALTGHHELMFPCSQPWWWKRWRRFDAHKIVIWLTICGSTVTWAIPPRRRPWRTPCPSSGPRPALGRGRSFSRAPGGGGSG